MRLRLRVTSYAVSKAPREISKEARKHVARKQAPNKPRTQEIGHIQLVGIRHVMVFTDLWPCGALLQLCLFVRSSVLPDPFAASGGPNHLAFRDERAVNYFHTLSSSWYD